MKALLFVLIFLSVSGCGSNQVETLVQTKYVEVEVPVMVPCRITPVEKPVDLVAGLKKEDDIYYKVKILLADLQLRHGYEPKLETAITSCNLSE